MVLGVDNRGDHELYNVVHFSNRSTCVIIAITNRRSSGEASKTIDYKSVFTNLCLELQQNRSWIKGLGKNPQKSELIH